MVSASLYRPSVFKGSLTNGITGIGQLQPRQAGAQSPSEAVMVITLSNGPQRVSEGLQSKAMATPTSGSPSEMVQLVDSASGSITIVRD